MIDVGNSPGNSARFYGLPSVESSPSFGLPSEPIIRYGTTDDAYGDFILNSTATMTINPALNLQIEVTEQFPPNQKLQVGWIVEMYGGNQRATSQTSIEIKTQDDLLVQFIAGQTGRAFRVGQTIQLRLNTDTSKFMLATIKTFIPSVGQMTIDVFATQGVGTYPQTGAQSWLISVFGSNGQSSDYMLARITDIIYPTGAGQPILMTFHAFQAYGLGTYAEWLIFPQWQRAFNLVRNLNQSAYDASLGPSLAMEPPYYAAANFVPFAGTQTVTNVVTSNTPYNQSGYTQIAAKGATQVFEDEYEAHRPYIGRTVTANGYIQTVVVTTVTTYSQDLTPTSVTTTDISQSSLSRSHTFSEADYVPNDEPGVKYIAGQPAVYSNGELVSAPTPSRYFRQDQTSGSITYIESEYERIYQNFEFGDPPVNYILQTLDKTTGKSLFITGYDKPSPEGFFYPA
jgi:hypothetical protein